MDYISNRALMISVSIFVTLAIVSGVLVTINQVKGIYKNVYETDVSIKKNFYEYDMYDNVEFTTVDVYNTAKKYYNSDVVSVYMLSYGVEVKLNTNTEIERMYNSLFNDSSSTIEPYTHKKNFKSNYDIDLNDRVKIIFTAI